MSDSNIPTFEQMRDRYVVLREAKDNRVARQVEDISAAWIAALDRYLLTAYGGTEPHAYAVAYARNLQHPNLGLDQGDIINRAALVVSAEFTQRGFQARVIHLTSDVGVRVSWDPNDCD